MLDHHCWSKRNPLVKPDLPLYYETWWHLPLGVAEALLLHVPTSTCFFSSLNISRASSCCMQVNFLLLRGSSKVESFSLSLHKCGLIWYKEKTAAWNIFCVLVLAPRWRFSYCKTHGTSLSSCWCGVEIPKKKWENICKCSKD